MYTIAELSALVERGIESIKLPEEPRNLYDPIRYALASGGKRLRPALTLAACNLFHPSVDQALYPSLAIEVFHNFTLLHDDIMDNAPLRRNRPSVVAQWGANAAILSGDAMNVIAYQLLARTDPAHLPQVLTLFNTLAQRVCEGQQLDMDFESARHATAEEYIGMIALKTAALLTGALQIGALVGGARQGDITRIGQFGRNLGIAFQLQDDLLDLYGEAAVFGKRTGGDILANKKTFLSVTAFALAKGPTLELLHGYYNSSSMDPDKKISGVRALFDELRVRELAEQEVKRYLQEAVAPLEQIEQPAERKVALRELAQGVMSRNH